MIDHPALSGLRTATLRRVRDGLARSETACVAQVLEIVQEMSQKADRLSVQDLAGLIGRDLTTVTKIMKAATCLGYNPAAVEVTTLSEAIAIIGFDKIRNLVLSLLLIEAAEKASVGEASQEVAGLALTSGLAAQAIIARYTSMDPELAFICGALRQYGHLLLSSFCREDYDDACRLARTGSGDSAFVTVFGLSPQEVSHEILEAAQVPRTILNTLRPADADLAGSDDLTGPEKLHVVTEFAGKICELISIPSMNAQDCRAALGQLCRTYLRSVPLTEQDLQETLGGVQEMISTFGRAQGLKMFSTPVIVRIRRLSNGESWSREKLPARGLARQLQLKPGETERTVNPLSAALLDIRTLLESQPRETRRIFSTAARALRAALHLRSCLVFLQENAGTFFAPLIGTGPLFEETRQQPLLNPQHRDVFTVCLERGEDALLQNPADPKIAPFIPEWFERSPNSGPFVLLPVQDETGTFAIFCGVVGSGERIELTATLLQQWQALRAHLATLRSTSAPGQAAA